MFPQGLQDMDDYTTITCIQLMWKK